MPRFAANLSFLFTEYPFPERFARAAAAGFRAVECLFPYEYRPEDLAIWLAAASLECALFNLPPGDWAAGERGLACLPGRDDEFEQGIEQAARYVAALNCRQVHCLAGLRPAGEDEAALRVRYIARLRRAADRFAPHGVIVLIEPINSRIDMPGYWLDSPAKALALLDDIDRPNVRLQLDLYHAHVATGDAGIWLDQAAGRLGHVQIADYPGRHEPGTGEIDFARLLARLDALGYSGWVGCEYRPAGSTEDGLCWLGAQNGFAA